MNLFHDNARNISVYDTPTPMDIARVCPDAFQIYNGMVGVPATLQNLQRLRAINYPIIPPMERYDWPGRFTPFEAQKTTANFLTANPRAFCLNDMGTGKTLAALWAADFVMAHYPRGTCSALIVAPLSTLRSVWGDAIFQNFLGRRTFSIVHGTARQREDALNKPADFYIINPDGLRIGVKKRGGKLALEGLAKQLDARKDIQIAIVDECSVYREAGTERHKAARVLLDRPYLWMMSGTPTPNGPIDAYGQAKLLCNANGESYTSYRNRVMYQLTAFKWVPRAGAMEEAKKLLSPSIRFAIADCIDLPPCTVQQRECSLSAEQTKLYTEMKKQLRLSMQSGKRVDAANEAVLRMKLLQISGGAVYDADHSAHYLDAGPRLAVLKEIIEESNDKVIVFAPLTSVLHLLHRELKDYSREMINGTVSATARTEIFRRFQSEETPRILIADPHTMSHGLTLTAATSIVWFLPTDKTEIYLQANKRIDRPGQTKTTTIVQIAATPIEKEIYRRLEANETMQGVILKLAHEEGRQ